MLMGLFWGHTVKSLERGIVKVRVLETRVMEAKQEVKANAASAIADRTAAIHEMQKDLNEILRVAARLN